jgi:hypothetical protein
MRALVTASMLALLTISSHAQGVRPEVQACGESAMNDYNKANVALLQQGTPLISIEATIAQRRLQEQFCLRFVRCAIADETSLRFIGAFGSCLQDEALEKYDAVPRTKD